MSDIELPHGNRTYWIIKAPSGGYIKRTFEITKGFAWASFLRVDRPSRVPAWKIELAEKNGFNAVELGLKEIKQ